MLISFTFENWRSFRDETSFSMLATSEKQHRNHLAHIPAYDRGRKRFELLPLAAMYGGNASGKSNFARALSFVRWMVTNGPKSEKKIVIQAFRLGTDGLQQPSSFTIQFVQDETVYSYQFSATTDRIEHERLGILAKNGSERLLFSRDSDKKIEFGPALSGDLQYLQALGRAMPPNSLYLAYVNAQDEKNKELAQIGKWFAEDFIIITPTMEFTKADFLLDTEDPLLCALNTAYPSFDTGISRLAGKRVPIEQHKNAGVIAEFLKEEVSGETKVQLRMNGNTVYCELVDGNWYFVKLVTYHKTSDGREIEFDFRQESDGSQRLYDLLPLFLQPSKFAKTIVIDEVDRSLHPLLTRQLLDIYLSNRTPESRSQLILTTHDAMLLDQDLLRRDEIWVAERDETGASKIFSFSDFKDVRADKDIRKSYLQGRMGGVPRLRMSGVFCPPEREPEHE